MYRLHAQLLTDPFVLHPAPYHPVAFTLFQTNGALSTDVPASILFVPGDAKTVAYSSPLLLGKVC